MAVTPAEQAVIDKLLATKRYSLSELKTIYKILCKNTHPDITGGGGEDFVRVQDTYTAILEKEQERDQLLIEDFNPLKVIRDAGYTGEAIPRSCLMVGIARYSALGMNTYKVRKNAFLKERNAEVIRTILYWADRYDVLFPDIFINYNRNLFQNLNSMKNLKKYLWGRKLFNVGLRFFLEFQDTGRISSGKIARDRLLHTVNLLFQAGSPRSTIIPFVSWLVKELEQPPVRMGLK